MGDLRSCPLCGSLQEQTKLFIDQNIIPERMTGFSFASRKEPEYMCYRMVQCLKCDLVYANTPPSQNELKSSYHQAEYDSSEEANDAAKSYIRAIKPILMLLRGKQKVLEIGTGNAIFLECLQREGFIELIGVEPSSAAIATAPESRRMWIREGFFDENNFDSESFDLICCFMTMEHVLDPKIIAQGAMNLLLPGGAFVIITHDYRGLINRVLGSKSPIIDIEHLQLFSKKSIRFLFECLGYEKISVQAYKNSYALRYWIRLFPIPRIFKTKLMNILKNSRIGNIKVSMNVGNLISVGFKKVD